MSYRVKNSLGLCFRYARTGRWLWWLFSLLLAVSTVRIVSATSVNTLELVSVNMSGTASGSSWSASPRISADGRFVVFTSSADDLVTVDSNGQTDVFIRDLQRATTSLVSINKAGADSGNGVSQSPVISADGRFVVFRSNADDLVPMDADGRYDVFVRDLQKGTTTLVSINQEGTGSGNGNSDYPVISADGRFVVFSSDSDDLVSIDSNGKWDIFVRDLQKGMTTLVSVNRDGIDSANAGAAYYSPVISANGRYVAFSSGSDDLVTVDSNGQWDVFVRDLQNGTTTLLSVNQDGVDSANADSGNPVISADGRFVVFTSSADDLVSRDGNSTQDVFIRDLQRATTSLVSINKAGADSGNDSSYYGSISTDGRFVAFTSNAGDLVSRDTNNQWDVFVRDLHSGTTSLVSINKDGSDSGNARLSVVPPAISADGRFVTFVSFADDLVATKEDNGPNVADVFVRDLERGTTTLVTANKNVNVFGFLDDSISPVISADGRFVAFDCYSDELLANDTNGTSDIFVFEMPIVPLHCNCDDPDAIKGTSRSDFLLGTAQADIICGFGGQDYIAGLDGDDCIDGGDGNDWIAGGPGDDRLDGAEGYDHIFCGLGKDVGIGEYLEDCEND